MQVRVYYADTDSLGIVYHANYLKYFEMARMEHLRKLGLELPWVTENFGLQFAVVKIEINYYKPARLNDLLNINTKIDKIGKASLLYKQKIYDANDANILLCDADIKLVAVDKNMQVMVLPAQIKAEIAK